MKPIALFLCDKSCNAARPWAAECWCVDIQHPQGVGPLDNNIRRVGADITTFSPDRPVLFGMHWTPCDHFAVSGARWFKEKGLEALHEALGLVIAGKRILERAGCPYGIENPVGTLSTYWRKPDHTFDPCDYAGYLADPSEEAYTKKTCLWTGGGFVMPEPKPVFPIHGSKMHLIAPSPERKNLRSVTPMGFAIAVFEANSKQLASV